MLAGAAIANCAFVSPMHGGPIESTMVAYKVAIAITLCGAFVGAVLHLLIRDSLRRESR
jgi:hypothetical protein